LKLSRGLVIAAIDGGEHASFGLERHRDASPEAACTAGYKHRAVNGAVAPARQHHVPGRADVDVDQVIFVVDSVT
jgi:hypothetical protein